MSILNKFYDLDICMENINIAWKSREGGMVLMDIESFGRREENLATAERLMAAEMARFMGTQGYTVDQFKTNMKQAIKRGTGKNV